ncbi:hypothetical protein BGZ50_005694 [Haplosporangium sp. Z 11]|nr:hypothetical protein BGZ50_005694 [Haplosporangium sp. Z 11]
MHPELSLTIGTLERLEVLRLSNFWNESKKDIIGLFSGVAKSASKLRDVVLMNVRYDKTELRHAVDTFAGTLERLIVKDSTFVCWSFLTGSTVLQRRPSGDYSDVFSRLTLLDVPEHSAGSMDIWCLVLLYLFLTHLGLCGDQAYVLNAAQLLDIAFYLPPLHGFQGHFSTLEIIPRHLNLLRLEVLMLVNCGYDKQSERILARRQDEFSERFMIYIGHWQVGNQNPTPDSNYDSIDMSSVSTVRRDDGALDPRRVKMYHAATNYIQLRFQLMMD